MQPQRLRNTFPLRGWTNNSLGTSHIQSERREPRAKNRERERERGERGRGKRPTVVALATTASETWRRCYLTLLSSPFVHKALNRAIPPPGTPAALVAAIEACRWATPSHRGSLLSLLPPESETRPSPSLHHLLSSVGFGDWDPRPNYSCALSPVSP